MRILPPLLLHALTRNVPHGMCGQLFPWGEAHVCPAYEVTRKPEVRNAR